MLLLGFFINTNGVTKVISFVICKQDVWNLGDNCGRI
jgi:hypothetical protein